MIDLTLRPCRSNGHISVKGQPTKKRAFVSIALAFVCLIAGAAHGGILPFKAYTTSDGLAHDRVNRIVQDSRGLLWFCTSEGLSRFDGYEFKNYTQVDGLPHRAVSDLLETRDGHLWVATGDGVVLFDPLGESASVSPESPRPMFRNFRLEGPVIGQTTWQVADLIEDRRGTIWIVAINGLYRLDGGAANPRIERIDTESWGHGSRDFTALLEDRTGAIWVGAERGLYRILPDGQVQRLDRQLRVGSAAMLEDRSGNIWVGTNGGESRGLYLYGLPDAAAEPVIKRVFYAADGLSGDHWMNSIIETPDGRLLVGTSTGLCQYDPAQAAGPKPFSKLFDAAIQSVGQDSGGNVWLGTGSSGAYRMAKQGFTSYDEADGLPTKSVASVVRGSDGQTYVIAGAQKISRFDGKGFTTVTPVNMGIGSWSINQIHFQDHAGEWWVMGSQGLQRYPRVERLEDLAHTPAKRLYTTADGLIDHALFQLFEDSRGDIWISIIGQQDSVNRWERSTDTIHRYTAGDGFPVANNPTALGEDRAGNVWMGYYLGGLGRFRNGRFEMFTAEQGAPPGYVRDIHTDVNGRLWIATSSGGVVRVDDPTAEHPVLTNITTAQGLSSNQANCITEDRFGRIYVGTGRGVSRLDITTGRVKIFTTTDGLRQNLITLCEAGGDGALWFATSLGLARYEPTAEEQTPSPPIFIGSVRANGDPARKLSELGEAAVGSLDLASDQRQVQIGFFALGFSTAETLRYQYKLDGSAADWSEPATQRTVNLNLSPGSYRFLVRAVTSDGVFSEVPASVSFSIARPVWQRWWFLLMLTVLIAGAVFALYSYRLKRLVELERVRTRIATDLHDDIGSSLSQIAILSEVVRQKIGDETVNHPLNMIADTSRDMVDSMSDIVWAINPEKDHLSDLLQRMRRFASDSLEASDIAYAFRSDEAHREIVLGADIRREVYLVFKECINNIVKHAGAGSVDMSVAVENKTLIVSVRDDGKGFVQPQPGVTSNGYDGFGGNGLVNMRRRSEGLGGSLIMVSEPGNGTTIEIRVPVNEKRRPRPAT